MPESNMQPQQPIQAAIEELQKGHSHPSSRRKRFFDRRSINVLIGESLRSPHSPERECVK